MTDYINRVIFVSLHDFSVYGCSPAEVYSVCVCVCVSVWCWCFYEAVFEQWQPVEHHKLWKLLWERDKGCEERPAKWREGNKPQNRTSLQEKEEESFISTTFSWALQLQLIFREVLWFWDGIGNLPQHIRRIDIEELWVDGGKRDASLS